MGYVDVVHLDSPAALWPLADVTEATSSLSPDISGNSRPLVWGSGAVTLGDKTMPFGRCTNFSSGNLQLTIAYDSTWMGSSHFDAVGSYEAWVNIPAALADYQGIFDRRAAHEAPTLYATPTGTLQFESCRSISHDTGVAICDGMTHHVVAAWDATDIRAYVDGALVDTQAAGAITGNTDQLIVSGEGGSRWVTGKMAMLGVYITKLSAAKVLTHYKAGLVNGTVLG